jgi:hypothetical protein
MSAEPMAYRGNDRLLIGMILGVLTFWLFAQTTLNIAPAMAALGFNLLMAVAAIVSIMLTVPKGRRRESPR